MKKGTKISLFSFLLLPVILVAATLFMFDTGLKSKLTPTDQEDAYTYLFKHRYLKQWIDSLNNCQALRDTFIMAPDGKKLHALYVKAAQPTANTALLVHGYGDNAIRMLMIGHLYNKELGYNILLPDLRGHGKTGGDYIQMGWNDRHDVRQWINAGNELFGDSVRFALHGISMGAAAVMMLSGDSLPDNVKCVIADCGYTSVWNEFQSELQARYRLPAFPLLNLTSRLCDFKLGWNFKEASSLDQVKKSSLPLFFIHGDADTYVPTYMVYELYDAKTKGNKQLWTPEGVKHAMSYWNYTDEYVKRTGDFVGRYMR